MVLSWPPNKFENKKANISAEVSPHAPRPIRKLVFFCPKNVRGNPWISYFCRNIHLECCNNTFQITTISGKWQMCDLDRKILFFCCVSFLLVELRDSWTSRRHEGTTGEERTIGKKGTTGEERTTGDQDEVARDCGVRSLKGGSTSTTQVGSRFLFPVVVAWLRWPVGVVGPVGGPVGKWPVGPVGPFGPVAQCAGSCGLLSFHSPKTR